VTREGGSIFYNCYWSSSAQLFLGLSPEGLMTTFYCLTFETLPTRKARSLYLYPLGTEYPSYTPGHWSMVQDYLWRYSIVLPHEVTPLIISPRKIEGYTALVDPKENTASNNSSVISAASSRHTKNYFLRHICYSLIALK
jgi:hypothetical protein